MELGSPMEIGLHAFHTKLRVLYEVKGAQLGNSEGAISTVKRQKNEEEKGESNQWEQANRKVEFSIEQRCMHACNRKAEFSIVKGGQRYMNASRRRDFET